MYALRQVITAMLLALACTANAETITGRVVGVADGDTITVLDADTMWRRQQMKVPCSSTVPTSDSVWLPRYSFASQSQPRHRFLLC